MARSEKKILSTVALTVTTQTVKDSALDITNYSGVSVSITTPAAAAGSMFLQWCNFNSAVDADWTAIPTAQYPNATVTLAASGSQMVNVAGLHCGFVRVRVTLSAGAGNYNFFMLAKDF